MNKSKQSFDITVTNGFHNTVIADYNATITVSHLKRIEIIYDYIKFFKSLKCDKPLLN